MSKSAVGKSKIKLRWLLPVGFCLLAQPLVAAPLLSDFVVYGTTSVTVGNNVGAPVDAAIGSSGLVTIGDVKLGGGNKVSGNIHSGGTVTAGSNTQVNDNIVAAGEVTLGGGSPVGGNV